MTVEFNLDDTQVPDGTVLLAGIAFDSIPHKTWTYSLIKAGGRWYTSGTGKAPQDAGWGAIRRWLAREGTRVVYIDAVTARDRLWEEDAVTPKGERAHLTIVRPGEDERPDRPSVPWTSTIDVDVPLHDGPDTHGIDPQDRRLLDEVDDRESERRMRSTEGYE
jgi:hypothetical protein